MTSQDTAPGATPPKRRRGRPPAPGGNRTHRLQIRTNDTEDATFALAAQVVGEEAAAYVRRHGLIAARKDIRAAGLTPPGG